jgi:GNAT superfamily N-acetyltransferase
MTDDVELVRYDATRARGMFQTLADVYADTYAELLSDPFRTLPRFLQRLDEYASEPRFVLITAHLDGELVGYALGYSLHPDSKWWERVEPPLAADFRHETDEGRTFVLEELMVRPPWRRHGIAHALYQEILSGRNEQRGTLLIRPGNDLAQTIAARCGWRTVGHQRPAPDAPVFDTFVRSLP